MTGEGASVTQAARIVKISRSTAYAVLSEHATAATPP
jgi:transposase